MSSVGPKLNLQGLWLSFDHLVGNARIVTGLKREGKKFSPYRFCLHLYPGPSAHRGRRTAGETLAWPNTGVQIWKGFLGEENVVPRSFLLFFNGDIG